MKKILVTGGLGYIGSHTCVELLQAGLSVVILDNLSNSSVVALNRIRTISPGNITLVVGDIRDQHVLHTLFTEHSIDAVIHFAGLKAVAEASSDPLRYYEHNVSGSITLLQAMAAHDIKDFVFSSSATVYGYSSNDPISESAELHPSNPYGKSKLMVENVLRDLHASDSAWNVICLRYFNPVGAHKSGCIGEDPKGIPNNLTPYITQVAVGRREKLIVFGGDYPTLDGTGVRDYIHVVDLARGHVKSVEKLQANPGAISLNLGTGKPCSVLQVLAAFEGAVGKEIPYEVQQRRDGDVAILYADPSAAKQSLGWEATLDIDDMARDSWRWQKMNPRGYEQ